MAGKAINLATAYVQIVPSMKNVGKSISEAFGAADTTPEGEHAGLQYAEGAKSGFSSLKAGALAGVFQSVTQTAIGYVQNLSGEMVEASDSAQKFASTLSFAGVSDATIKKLTASTQEYADKTVFNLNDIRNTTAQLAANGVPNYEKLAEAAGNLTAVAGGGADAFSSVAMALTQTAGAGKLTTENWNQIADAIPGASGKLQEAMKANGAYTGDFRDAMAKGQITADEFNQALLQLGMSDTAVQAAQSASTIEGASGNLEASVTKLGATVIDKAKPAVTQLMNSMSDFVGVVTGKVGPAFDWLSQHGTTVKTAIIGVATAWASLHSLMAVGTLAQAVAKAGGMIPMLAKWASGLNVVKAAQLAWNGAITVWSVVTKVATAVQAAFNAVANNNPIGRVIMLVSGLITLVVLFFTKTEIGRQWWAAISAFMINTWNNLKAVAGPVFEAIGTVISNVWNGVKTVTQTVWTFIKTWIWPVIQGIGEFIKDVFIVLAAVLATIWHGISTVVTTVWNGIVNFLRPIVQTISSVITTAINFIRGIWETVWGAISGFFQRVWTAMVAVYSPIINSISQTISNVVNSIRGTWERVWGAVSGFFTGVWDGMKHACSTAIHWIADKVGGIKDKVTAPFRNAVNWLKDAGKQIIGGLWNGIGDKARWLKDKITGLGHQVVDWAKGVLGIHSPSRVFADQVGRYIPAGMALGITRNLTPVQQAMDTMGGIRPTGVWTPGWPGMGAGLQGMGVAQAMQGDIIIPVYLGGSKLDEMVVTAARRADYRRG
jgi:tape measure domain-containing protein